MECYSLKPVAAMPCTKWRRMNAKKVMLGMSASAAVALRRPRSMVKPDWNSASPTSSV